MSADASKNDAEPRILIVDDDPAQRSLLDSFLGGRLWHPRRPLRRTRPRSHARRNRGHDHLRPVIRLALGNENPAAVA